MTKSLDNDDFSKDLVVFPVSRHLVKVKVKVKVSRNRETPKSLEYGKCPETGKRQNPLRKSSIQGTLLFLMFLYIFL